MLNQAQLTQYEELGYVILENLFAEAEIDELRARLDRYDEEYEHMLTDIGQQFLR